MRRILAVLLGVLAVVFSAQTAHAEEYTTYYLNELRVSVDVPKAEVIVTRDIADGDPCLAFYGCTAEDMRKLLEETSNYLTAGDWNGSYRFHVMSSESVSTEFNDCTDSELAGALEVVKENYIQSGATWIDGFIFEHSQTKFICLEAYETVDGSTTYTRKYYTFYDGQYFAVCLYSYSGEITQEFRDILKHMAESVRFGADPPPVEPQPEVKPLAGEEFQTFYLRESDLEITIPGSYVVFTRDTDPEDPNFERMGCTWEQVTESMENGNVYLDALTLDKNMELLVVTVDYPYGDFNDLSESQIKESIQIRKKRLEDDGMKWISAKVFEHHQAKFLQIDYSYDFGWTVGYAREYYTLYADKVITITLSSYAGKIPAEQEALLAGIINSVYFGTEPAGDSKESSRPVPQYRDELTGLIVSPPNLWNERPASRQDSALSVQFTFSANAQKKIQIYSRDLFTDKVLEKLFPDLDRETLPRSNAGHELLTEEIVAELLRCDVSEVGCARYGGREYFRADFRTSTKVNGKQESTPTCALVRIENGYLYIFQYIGETTDGSFLNFRKMVAGAVYPSGLSEEEPVPEEEAPPDAGETDVPEIEVPPANTAADAEVLDAVWTYLMVAFLAIIAVIICVLIGVRSMRRCTTDAVKVPAERDPWERTDRKTPEEMPAVESVAGELAVDAVGEASETEGVIQFCRNCGFKLLPDSRFCSCCGTKVYDQK